jgi:hypothetical protein
LLADKGYQGINLPHANSIIPHKKSKKETSDKRAKPAQFSTCAITNLRQHGNCGIKMLKNLSYRYRNKQRKHLLRVS